MHLPPLLGFDALLLREQGGGLVLQELPEGMPCDDAKAWVFVMFKLCVKSIFLNCVRASSFAGIGDALPQAKPLGGAEMS